MPNNISFAQNYTAILDEVYQRSGVSNVLDSGRRMVRAGRNAKEIMIPKIEVTGLGDYTRNIGYQTGAITYEFETKAFNYDRGIRLFADVMDVEEGGILDCFVAAGAELQRTRVAPEADTFTFSEIAGHQGRGRDGGREADAQDATETAERPCRGARMRAADRDTRALRLAGHDDHAARGGAREAADTQGGARQPNPDLHLRRRGDPLVRARGPRLRDPIPGERPWRLLRSP